MFKKWNEFEKGAWTNEINVRDFIQKNYSPYTGDESFLAGKSEKTAKLFAKVEELLKEEQKRGIYDIYTDKLAAIDCAGAGYVDRDNETIVGLQSDGPLKRLLNPYGGVRMVEGAIKAYNLDVPCDILADFKKYRKSHNEGVFDVYNDEIKKARSVGLMTGLPDAYGRGRIIGDYRRIALYGIDYLIEEKKNYLKEMAFPFTEESLRNREEISEQIKALNKMKTMASAYGIDISVPAENAQEAVQFLYFGYLAGVKENNGAAMSLGRTSSFLDIYIEKDIEKGLINEVQAQELIDQFVIKLRIIRHLRTPEYDELFAGDPNWITEVLGGMGEDGRTLVTKTTYRFLHTLTNLSAAPEPNMTVLWSENLPESFKKYCSRMSIETSSIQYENDDIMRPMHGDDYAIACCISAMRVGKEMQFFGARCNLAKALLFAINGGVDELTGETIIEGIEKIDAEILDFDQLMDNYKIVLSKVAELYVNTMNSIHYMHDKYAYEAGQMALHDGVVGRYMAFGVAGLSIVMDSFSAVKHAEVKAVRENGLTTDFEINGEYPAYGNDLDEVDYLGNEILSFFTNELRKHKAYRDAKHTLSVLTITSNVVYGKKTGTTPDGRKAGAPFAPGANPMHGRDSSGALASLNSVAKLQYEDICEDGISNTFTVIPEAIGKLDRHRIDNLATIMDGYFGQKGHHLNVNVLRKELLLDAYDNPDKYPNLTIRVSGYAVKFNKLTKEQQMDVINRTFHKKM
ncbi:formate C-acetyltransferase [Dethiosulfatibacter aminovorans]|nr:formate C-acetyltransferase [Dethiosulfatibacter aminovorans]